MIGERAEMAVTPQMEQPAAIKALMRGARPSLLPNQGITVNPVPTEKITAGIPTAPVVRISTALSLAPMQTIPVCSTAVLHIWRPGLRRLRALAGTMGLFLSPRPSSMATGMPEMGLAPISSLLSKVHPSTRTRASPVFTCQALHCQ